MPSTRLEITRPDDWHLHLRDGAALGSVVTDTARQFARAHFFQPRIARELFQLTRFEPHPYIGLRVAQRFIHVPRVVEQ